MKESSLRNLKKKCYEHLRKSSKEKRTPETELIALPRGRPVMLGMVQNFLLATRTRGGLLTFHIAIAKKLLLLATQNTTWGTSS